MLKIQELNIDGTVYRLREPRLSDYLRAKKAPEDEFVFSMLSGMMIDEKGDDIGADAVYELPLRIFDVLSQAVNEMTLVRRDPLAPEKGSSTGSL